MKSMKDITFDEDLLEKYQSEIENINKKIEQLNNSKSFQKLYKKYLKTKESIEFHYNKINDDINSYKIIDTKSYAVGLKNSNKYQLDGRFC